MTLFSIVHTSHNVVFLNGRIINFPFEVWPRQYYPRWFRPGIIATMFFRTETYFLMHIPCWHIIRGLQGVLELKNILCQTHHSIHSILIPLHHFGFSLHQQSLHWVNTFILGHEVLRHLSWSPVELQRWKCFVLYKTFSPAKEGNR